MRYQAPVTIKKLFADPGTQSDIFSDPGTQSEENHELITRKLKVYLFGTENRRVHYLLFHRRRDKNRPIPVRIFEMLFYEVPGTYYTIIDIFPCPWTQSEENQHLIT